MSISDIYQTYRHVLVSSVVRSVTGQRKSQTVMRSNYGTRKGCGIVQDWAKFFYKSKQWQRVRDYVMKRDQWLCQDCLKKGKYVPAEEVHHIVPLKPENITDPSITLDENNLVALCRECHKARHGARERRYSVDEYGRVIIK